MDILLLLLLFTAEEFHLNKGLLLPQFGIYSLAFLKNK